VLIADLSLHEDAIAWLESIKDNQSDAKVIFERTDVSKGLDLEKAFDMFAQKLGEVPYIVCAGAGIYEPVSSTSACHARTRIVNVLAHQISPATISGMIKLETIITTFST
jgi:hypothetical protein